MDTATLQLDYLTKTVGTIYQLLESKLNDTNLTSDSQSLKTQEYYTLKDAVALKYGTTVSYSTVKTNYLLMPCCNTNYIVSAGKRMWKKEIIEEWLEIQDKDIPNYAKKYGVQLVGRLGDKYKKYE